MDEELIKEISSKCKRFKDILRKLDDCHDILLECRNIEYHERETERLLKMASDFLKEKTSIDSDGDRKTSR